MTAPTDTVPRILALCDDGKPPVEIAALVDVTISRVYTVLQKHRPNRPRKPRTRTGKKREAILNSFVVGNRSPQAIINDLATHDVRVCRYYVHKVLGVPGGSRG